MKQTRSNVFETNSSSSHSLVIRNDALMNELGENIYFTHEEMFDSVKFNINNGIYSNDDWYFGRYPFRPLYTFDLRFRYAYANYSASKEKLNNLMSIVKKLVPEIKSVAGAKYAGVDDCLLDYWLEKNHITLKEFLINKKYIVIQDGDEYYIWADLIRDGLIDTESLDNKEGVERYARI